MTPSSQGLEPATFPERFTPYANGGLFESPARVDLTREELEHLRAAAGFQWKDVQPSIFGSLLEGGLGHDQQWRLGAHYTHEADIQKVVQPTIVEPWRERIENLGSHREAVAAQNDLLNYVVLDPACGSGNFLYVAYRELRRLEQRLHEREVDLRRREGLREQGSLSLHFPLSNVKGIEIEGFAVALARVTLWMGHKLAVDELGLSESTLPLADLSGIQIGDALRMEWPRADAIIGNPPFHGARNLRRVLGDEYVAWLRSEFDIGVKDYCVYWFRRAQQRLVDGGRAGLVATNSIRQNLNREVSLDYLAREGSVIHSAVSTQDWPGEAAVDVSIINWVKRPAGSVGELFLDGVKVAAITPRLTAGVFEQRPAVLAENSRRAFRGIEPGGDGFVIHIDEAQTLLLDPTHRPFLRPFLTAVALLRRPDHAPDKYVIDFTGVPLEEALRYPALIELVRTRVKPFRDSHRDERCRRLWWQFRRPVTALREAVIGTPRHIVAPVTGKRILFTWSSAAVLPSNGINAFAFSDDFSLGVLSSSVHHGWFTSESGTLEDRQRYNPATAFETFPWPEAVTADDYSAIGGLATRVISCRDEICVERQIGLNRLYNEVDEGAYAELSDLHRQLDEAVAGAYGWPRAVAHDPGETNVRLLALNREIAAGERPYDPFRHLR